MAGMQRTSSAPPLTLDNVLVAVKGVHWRTLGEELIGEYIISFDPQHTNLDEINDKYETDDARLGGVVEKFLSSHQPSWRKLTWALYKANAVGLADRIRSYAEPLEDATLSADNITTVMELVTADMMMVVWGRLVVPASLVARTMGSLSTPKEKTRACVDLYLNCHPNPSWKSIGTELYRCEEMAAAREAKPFYYQNDPTLTIENLVGVMEKVTSDEEKRREVWEEVLMFEFGTPQSYLDEVYTKYTGDEMTHTLADVYVYSRPESSWKHLLKTLYYHGEMAAAKEAKTFLQQQNDATLSADNITTVMELVTGDRMMVVWGTLDVPASLLASTMGSLSTPKEKTRACVDLYLNCHPNPSWKSIGTELYRCEEMAAAREAKPFYYQNDDPTLKVENIVNVMEKVTVTKRMDVWMRVFGWAVDSYVESVHSSYSTEEERTFACSDTYVHCCPESSWENLTSVLYEKDEMPAVDLARPFLPPRDLTITTSRLMKIFQSVYDPDAVDDWSDESIGELLGLPKSEIVDIQGSFQTASQRKEAYFDAYTHHHPCPSWRKVVEVLQRCDLDQEASEVENTYVEVSERTQRNFDIAMAGGTVMIRNGNVLFLGPGGSGKSHAIAAFLDEKPPSQRQSTACAEKPVRTVAQLKVDVNVKDVRFVRIADDEYSDMVSTTAVSQHFQPGTNTVSSTGVHTKIQVPETAVTKSTSVPSSTELSDVSKSKDDSTVYKQHKKHGSQSHRTSGFELELQRRMQALPKSSTDLTDLNDKDLVDMRDSGGQPSFHEVLPVFVENTTFGILTVKLNETLDTYPLVEYYSNGKPIGEPFPSPFTHLQTFRHCMRVLQSTCKKDARPKFVFLGTHEDREHDCEENRQEKNRKIRSIIPPDLKDSILYSDHSNKELLFAVNVKTPGNDDRKEIGRIRKMIIQELQKVPKKPLPLRYFALENAFLRLAKYKRKGMLSKEECVKEASRFGFTRESLDAALKYLHGLKLIFYFEEILPEVVFIDAQTILDMITELVEYSLCIKSPSVAMNIENVKAYGIITDELLLEPQFHSHYVSGLFMKDQLVSLLKYLRVLAEVGKGKYLVPCLLKVEDILRPLPDLANRAIPALLFYFGLDGPKLGVYCFLITSLITDAKWELMTENGDPVQISRNRAQFAVPGDNPGCITIIDSFSTFFHVSIEFPKEVSSEQAMQICEEYCPSIRETILTCIRKASQKLNYNNSIPKAAFPCSQHAQSALHPATISNSRTLLTCTASRATACSEVTGLHKVWLNDDAGNLSGDHTQILDQVLGTGSSGASKHLGQIAESMYEWEGLVADQLGLTLADANEIKTQYPMKLKLQMRAALEKWKQYNGSKATYRNLVDAFEQAGHQDFADNVRRIIGSAHQAFQPSQQMSAEITASPQCLLGVSLTSRQLQSRHEYEHTAKGSAYQAPPPSQQTSVDVAASSQCLLDHKPTLGKLRVLESHGGNKVHIIKRLAPHWTVMGDLLEFDDSGTQLSIIEEKHDGAPEACCRAMFQHWIKGNGVKPCSWYKLIKLMRDCDLEELAQLAQETEVALLT